MPNQNDAAQVQLLQRQISEKAAAFQRDRNPKHMADVINAQTQIIAILIGVASPGATAREQQQQQQQQQFWQTMTTTLKAARDAANQIIRNLT